jgi:hypothetical protein
MSAGPRVAIFVALLAAIFVVAVLAGRAMHPRSGGHGASTHSGGEGSTRSAAEGGMRSAGEGSARSGGDGTPCSAGAHAIAARRAGALMR